MTAEDAMKRMGAVTAEDAMKKEEVVAWAAAGKSIEGQNIAQVSEIAGTPEIIAGEKVATSEKAGIEKTGMERVEIEEVETEKNETEENETKKFATEKNATEITVTTGIENIAETGTKEETQAAKEPESEAEKPESAPTFVIKKATIKKALLCAAGLIAAIIFLVCCLGNAEIRDVKNGVLEDYNYGVSIGDALHKWFGGTEKWSSYSEDGVVYVMAHGMTKYTVTKKSQEQIFLFHHINDEYFVFDGAFDMSGDYLYMGNGDVDLFDLGDMIVYGLYEQTLKAAFGDKETLKKFMEQE